MYTNEKKCKKGNVYEPTLVSNKKQPSNVFLTKPNGTCIEPTK